MRNHELDREHLELLLRSSSLLNSTLSLAGVLSYLLRETLKIVGAQNGCILLYEKDSWKVQVSLPESVVNPYFSKTILQRVAREQITLCLLDASQDESFGPLSSVQHANVRAVLCSPLIWQGEVRGAIYLDHRVSEGVFKEEHQRLVEALGQQAAIALDNAALHEEREQLYELNLKQATQKLADTEALLFDAHELAGVITRALQKPVSSLESSLTVLKRTEQDELAIAPIQRMDETIEQSNHLLQKFRDFIEPDRSVWTNISLDKLLGQILDNRFPAGSRVSTERYLEPVKVFGDAGALTRAIISLLENAEDALADNQEPALISIVCRPGETGAVLEIADNAGGISAELESRIFEPFFTTRANQNRSGLGLSLISQIFERHSASIQIRSLPGLGTRFIISFTD